MSARVSQHYDVSWRQVCDDDQDEFYGIHREGTREMMILMLRQDNVEGDNDLDDDKYI
jgi:hypothetical protein